MQGARPITVTAGPVQVQYKIPCFTVFALLQLLQLTLTQLLQPTQKPTSN